MLFVAPSQESIPTGDLDRERQHTYYVYVVVTLEGYKLLQLSDENDDIERKRDLQNVIKNAIKNGGKIEGATGFTGNYSDQSFLGIPNLQPLWPPRDISPNDHDWQIVNSVYRRSILSTLGISPDVPSLPLPDSIGVAFSKSSIFRM